MGELVDRDLEHLRLLQLGYYIQAAMTGFFSLFGIIYAVLGFLFMTGAVPPDNNTGDPKVFGAIFAGIGLLFLAIGAAIALLTWLAGRYLRDRRRRVYCIVVASLSCLQFPYGTVLGVCTMMVLSRPTVKALFERPPESALTPTSAP